MAPAATHLLLSAAALAALLLGEQQVGRASAAAAAADDDVGRHTMGSPDPEEGMHHDDEPAMDWHDEEADHAGGPSERHEAEEPHHGEEEAPPAESDEGEAARDTHHARHDQDEMTVASFPEDLEDHHQPPALHHDEMEGLQHHDTDEYGHGRHWVDEQDEADVTPVHAQQQLPAPISQQQPADDLQQEQLQPRVLPEPQQQPQSQPQQQPQQEPQQQQQQQPPEQQQATAPATQQVPEDQNLLQQNPNENRERSQESQQQQLRQQQDQQQQPQQQAQPIITPPPPPAQQQQQQQRYEEPEVAEQSPTQGPQDYQQQQQQEPETAAADPRLGRCTSDELSALAQHFADGSACPAFGCIDRESSNYLALIEEHYGHKYTPAEAGAFAGVLAACHCRCPVMRCEVEYVNSNGSNECKEATKEFCLQSNDKFSDKCAMVARQLPKVYDIEADPHAFRSPCQVCEYVLLLGVMMWPFKNTMPLCGCSIAANQDTFIDN